jgi:hypothetical protein
MLSRLHDDAGCGKGRRGSEDVVGVVTGIVAAIKLSVKRVFKYSFRS